MTSPLLPSTQPGRHRLRIVSGGRERRAVLYRPPGTDESLSPLVVTLHGSASGAVDQLRVTELEAAADLHRFLLVAPQAAVPAGPGYRWAGPRWPGDDGSGHADDHPDDVAFLADLLDALVSTGQVDARRVYLAGMSGGARLACQFAGDRPGRVAALAAIAGLRAGPPSATDPTVPDRLVFAPQTPTPVLAFHGTADPVNPFDGGGPPYWGYGVRVALARWAEVNRCRAEPVETEVAPGVSVVSHPVGADGADTVLYVLDGVGHTWPGSRAQVPAELGRTTADLEANTVMWRFFRNRTAR